MTLTDRIEPGQDIIDSRDIIERIEELEELEQAVEDAREDNDQEAIDAAYADFGREEDDELGVLRTLADEASCAADWLHGETLIHEDYFTDYIKELIHDCYEMPSEIESGNWPWRHVEINYEAAADEAKVDYQEVTFDGEYYLIRV